jgi:hypothetical protein
MIWLAVQKLAKEKNDLTYSKTDNNQQKITSVPG